jgi:hypothetical protein
MGAMTATAHAKNRSEQPVYDLLFIWHDDCRPVAKTQRLRPLDAQHDQLESLRKVNEKQIEVLGLQATDLRESLDERKREAEELRSAQAARVFISQINGTRFRSTELNMSELLDSDTPIEFPASEPECFRATLTAGLLLSLVWTARNWRSARPLIVTPRARIHRSGRIGFWCTRAADKNPHAELRAKPGPSTVPPDRSSRPISHHRMQ